MDEEADRLQDTLELLEDNFRRAQREIEDIWLENGVLTCHDSMCIFRFLLLLFITCTTTVGHMTDTPSFRTRLITSLSLDYISRTTHPSTPLTQY
jgi:hypothetical protein